MIHRLGRPARWIHLHWDEISVKVKEPYRRLQLPPVIKVRLEFATEKVAYEAASDRAECYEDVKIVRQTETVGQTVAIVSTKNVPDATAEQGADAPALNGD
jgi:hypothetical protein